MKDLEKELKNLRVEMNSLFDSQDKKLLGVAEEHSEVLKQLIVRVKALEKKLFGGEENVKENVEEVRVEQRGEAEKGFKTRILQS
ncbi:hypothetical protein JW865_08210 [Candidatus Bathyarchaeota archaeon]|nr:hypothetical protein [Candidatus Bathyarchaeota archaeon]